MNNLQQWSYRLFWVIITTALALSLGWVGAFTANQYTDWLQKAYQISLSSRQVYLVNIGFVMIGVLFALLLSSWLTQKVWTFWESIENLSVADKISVLFGVLLGLALAYMVLLMPLMLLRGRLPMVPLLALAVAITSIIVYFSVHTLMKVRDALSVSFIAQQLAQFLQPAKVVLTEDQQPKHARDKVLDTNILIDGRLADIVRTGFIEGKLIIPSFVLHELRMIADSKEDELKRARGRRGLSILETLQSMSNVTVEIVDEFSPDVEAAPDTDSKLIRFAKEERKAAIITNDNNLQKIAELQGIPVLSVNELAAALKPVVLPGEELTVVIQRPGKEPGQGVGYLDDGTMVVVEQGRPHVGHEVRIKVTSVLQSPVGKMIFGDFKGIVRRNVIKSEGGDLFG